MKLCFKSEGGNERKGTWEGLGCSSVESGAWNMIMNRFAFS